MIDGRHKQNNNWNPEVIKFTSQGIVFQFLDNVVGCIYLSSYAVKRYVLKLIIIESRTLKNLKLINN